MIDLARANDQLREFRERPGARSRLRLKLALPRGPPVLPAAKADGRHCCIAVVKRWLAQAVDAYDEPPQSGGRGVLPVCGGDADAKPAASWA